MDTEEARRRFADSRVARLATVRPTGAPHLVPITFALDGDLVVTAVDAKPKRHRHLQRLENLRHEPRCALLADGYDDDWRRLWWVRADGVAQVDDAVPNRVEALLQARYAAYRERRPEGPFITVTVNRWTGWSAG